MPKELTSGVGEVFRLARSDLRAPVPSGSFVSNP